MIGSIPRGLWAVPAATLAVLAGACTAGTTTAPASVTSVPSSTPSSPSSPSAPSSASAPPSTPVRAPDGRNFAACATGTCTVLVRAGDTVRWRGNSIAITAVADGMVGVDAHFADGSSIKTSASGPFYTTADGSVDAAIVGVGATDAALRIRRV